MQPAVSKSAFCLAAGLIAGSNACSAAAQTSQDKVQVRRLGIPNGIEASPESLSAIAPASAAQQSNAFDWSLLQQIWDDVGTQEWIAADQKLKRLKAAYPDWRAPAHLQSFITEGPLEQNLIDAINQKAWGDVLELVPANGAECQQGLQVEARTKALTALDQNVELMGFLETVFANCSSQSDQQNFIDRVSTQLDLNELETFRQSAPTATNGLDWSNFDQAIASGQRLQAAANEDWPELVRLSELQQDHGGLLQGAWGLIETDPLAAQKAFQTAVDIAPDIEAMYGRALAAYQNGELSYALALDTPAPSTAYAAERQELIGLALLKHAELDILTGNYASALDSIEKARQMSPSLANQASALNASVSLTLAGLAYESGDYAKAIELAETAQQSPGAAAAAKSRIAWANLQLNNDQAAYDAFLGLYTKAKSDDAAQGLVLAAGRLGQLDQLAILATDKTGPLYLQLSIERGRRAMYNKRYLTSLKLTQDALPELEGVDNPYVRQSVSAWFNDLSAGEGQVNALISRTSLGFAIDTTHVEAGAVAYSIDAGTGADVNRSSDEFGVSPFIKFESEGPLNLSGKLGATPIGGPIDATITGALGATFTTAGTDLSVSLNRQSVNETLTSLIGREDAVTGETWGRVIENAGSLIATRNVTKNWTVRGETKVGVRTGNNVEDNTLFLVGAGATRSISVKNHDYLAVGPFYQFQAFDQNTNFHSAEQGGYFSPQSYHRVGAGIYGATTDLRAWGLRYQGAVALEVSDSDSAAVRPLTNPDGLVFAGGSSGVDIAGTLEVEYGRRITNKWTLTTGVTATASQAFNEARFSIALKYVPGGKARVTTRDFWQDPFSRDLP